MIATYIIDLDLYYIKLNSGTYRVNGEEMKISSSLTPIALKDVDNIFRVISSKVITHYIADNSDMLDVYGYNSKLNSLTANCDEDMYFSNIDDEYKYKKFKQKFRPVYQTILSEEKIDVSVQDYVYTTGNKFIESPLMKSSDIVKANLLYEYRRKSAMDYIFNEAIKDLPDNVRVDKSHNLEYAKLNGDYIFTSYKEKFTQNVRRGTLDDLIKLYDNDVKFVNDTIKKYFILKSDKMLNDLSLYEINKLINKISSYSYAITPIKRHDFEYNSMVSDIKKLKTAFDTALLES